MSRTEIKPRFSIVIPVRNMAKELPGAIESILNQTISSRPINTGIHNDVEIQVVVDDIDPETRKVLEHYGDRLSWCNGDRRGQSGAVVKGLNLTSGEIVKWLNADDRLLPGALESMDKAFSENPSVDFFYGDIIFTNKSDQPISEHLEPKYSRFVMLYGHNAFADPTCFWRRSLHKKIGPISENTRYSLDYEFWVRIARHRIKVGQVKQRIAAFKVTGSNLSVANHRAMRYEHFEVVCWHFPFWRVLPIWLRNGLLSMLLIIARVWKKLLVLFQRGRTETRGFARLAALPESDA